MLTFIVPGTCSTLGGSLGKFYLFYSSDGVSNWSYKTTVSPTVQYCGFGTSLRSTEIDSKGDTFVSNNYFFGTVYIYYEENNFVTPDLITGRYDDRFGMNFAIFGPVLVISASFYGTDMQGAVYVYEYLSGRWQQTAMLSATSPQASDFFGSQVAFDGITIYAQNSGQCEVVMFRNSGSWTQVIKQFYGTFIVNKDNLFQLSIICRWAYSNSLEAPDMEVNSHPWTAIYL